LFSRALTVACIAGLALSTTAALGQFSSDPAAQLQVGFNAGAQSKVRKNPLGGSYIAWQGAQGQGGNTHVQRLDADGNAMWAAGGVQVTSAAYTGSFEDFGFDVDASGNVLVAHRDNSSGVLGISLQKVAPDGTPLWGANGVAIPGGPAGSTDSPHSPRVTCLSDGGYAVGFSRGSTTSTATSRACYQKVSASGTLLWNGGQAVVIAPAANGYSAMEIVAGDNGDAIAFFFTSGSFSVSRRIHAQKLDGATGAQLWNGGSPVIVQLASTLQIGNFPQVLSDGSGGALVTWYETSSPLQCLVQHLNSSGASLFPAGGATATNGAIAGQQRVSPHVAYDAVTQTTYMAFSETNTSQGASGLGVQAFDAAGNRLWGDAGQVIVPVGVTSHQCTFARASLTSGGFIATWFESDNAGVASVVRSAKLNAADGTTAWASPITTVNSSQAAKSRLDVVAASAGGPTIATYGDGGVTNVIASRINDDGTIGPAAPTCGTSDFNGDSDFGTDADIEAFFACLAGNCCPTCFVGGSDFNQDGDFGTDADIESFFRVLGGGPC